MDIELPVAAALKIYGNYVKGISHLDAYNKEIELIVKREIINNPLLKRSPQTVENIRKQLFSKPPAFIKGYITNKGNFIPEPNIVSFFKKNKELVQHFYNFLREEENVETDFSGYLTRVYLVSPTLHKFNNYLRSKGYITDIWGERFTTFQSFYEASDNLHDWFKRGGKDPKTGKKFHGWVNCKTGGPCGRSSKQKGGSYPACRPTKQACRSIKSRMYKKTSSKRVNWKK